MSKQFLITPLLLLVLLLAGCQSPRTFERNDPSVPFLAVRVYYGDAGTMRKLVEIQDDFAQRFRGMRRVGDGILSAGVRAGRGRWVESYDCGGHLFVAGASGQPCQIVLRNESKNRLEVVAGMDGRDAITGGEFNLGNRGIFLAPSQTIVIGKVKRRKPASLHFGPGRAASLGPVIETAVKPSEGSILLAVFHEKDRLPWEGGSLPARKSPPPGKHSQPQDVATPRTFDYR